MATSTSKALPTPEKFIEAWQSSSSLREVAFKLRMNTNQARLRGWRYRQRGIPLKAMPPPDLPDWLALAAFAAKMGPHDAPSDGDGTEANEPAAVGRI